MWTLKEMDFEVEGFVAGLALVVLMLVGAFIPQVPGGNGETTRPLPHAPLTIQLDMPAITAHRLNMAFQHRGSGTLRAEHLGIFPVKTPEQQPATSSAFSTGVRRYGIELAFPNALGKGANFEGFQRGR